MATSPLVSIVIPVFNGEVYLRAALESVQQQTYQPLEIIVVDDGSEDGSVAVAKALAGVDCLERPHEGLGATRNAGVERARGEFVAFLDADDEWLPEKTTVQMEAFRKHPELDMVFGHVQQFSSPELDAEARARLEGDGDILQGFFAGTLLIRREAFFRTGRFETHWRVGEFIDWYLRALEQGLKSALLPEVVMRRRLHATNMGIREKDSRLDYVRIVKASLDRRRAAQAKKSS